MNVSTISNLLSRATSESTTSQGDFTVKATPPGGFYDDFTVMLNSIMNVVLTIGVIAVLLYLIWGGIEWITSGGNTSKTESARNKITASIIGLIILISAWAIMLFVQQLLGLEVFS